MKAFLYSVIATTLKVRACTPKSMSAPKRFVQANVAARRRGNLMEKARLLHFTRNDNSLSLDLGLRF
jgi:hypothetical protein